MVFGIPTTTSATMYFTPIPAIATAPALKQPRTIDAASMMDAQSLDKRVLEMVRTPIVHGVYDYFLNTIVMMVAGALIGPTHKVALGLKSSRLTALVRSLVEYGGVTMPALLVALVYLQRIRPALDIDNEDWVCERLALGALMTAQKYIIDPQLTAQHFALASLTFSAADVCRMEREFLALLEFDMRVTDADLLAHYDGLQKAIYSGTATGRPARGSVYARRERAEYRYRMHSRSRSPSPEAEASSSSALHLPELAYPDSPDSYDSPQVVTPPSVRAWRGQKTANPYLAHHWQPYPSPPRDREMEARVRWYAAAGLVPGPSASASPYMHGPRDSPRFEPFSPPTMRYERPEPANYPWRRYQAADYDPTGLFKLA